MRSRLLLVVSISWVGCAAIPPCPPAPLPPAAAASLPACPREPPPDASLAERDRLVSELRQLRESLGLLPSERTPVLGADAKQLLTRLRVMLLELRALDASPGGPVPEDLSMLAALRRMSLPIAQEIEQARAGGLGDGHPRIRSLVARHELVARQFELQQQTDGREAAALEATLSAANSPMKFDATGMVVRALADRFGSPDFTLARVASFDPISLRLLALESARLEGEAATLSQIYGPRHPRMLALEEKRLELAERFRAWSHVLKSKLDATGAQRATPLGSALATGDDRDDRARELADEIALLSIRIADTQPHDASAPAPRATPCVMGAR